MEKTWNVQNNLRYLNLKIKNFEYSREKMMSLLPLMLTNSDKFFIGGTKHHALLPCKISSKSEHVKYQKWHSKIQYLKKVTPKIVFELGTLP